MSYFAIAWLCLLAFLVVVILEMFLPTAGILFVLSMVLAVAAVIAGFMHSVYLGAIMIVILGVSLPVLFALFSKVWPHTPLGKRLIIPAPTRESVLPSSALDDSFTQYKGAKGEVVSPMLPTGSIRIGEKTLVATCESGSVALGQWVRVVKVQMNRLFVVPVELTDDLQSPGGFEQKLDQTVQATMQEFDWDSDTREPRAT
ncbi:MAG: NfeD family protein [Pirellulaceae bacterium]|nr:NfeD family protein [Pirellulaceae bacterium]